MPPIFTCQLPWFYHGLPFDKLQTHDIYSFEVNGLELPADDYTVALVPHHSNDTLDIGFNGLTFKARPIRNGRIRAAFDADPQSDAQSLRTCQER